MTDFDERLRARLARLEAAVPEPALPGVLARKRGPRRRRQVVVLLAATVALVMGASMAALGALPQLSPDQQAAHEAELAALEQRVFSELRPLFPPDECVSREEAERAVQQGLDAAGLSDWTVTHSSWLPDAPCVTFGAAADSKSVILLGAMLSGGGAALEDMANELLEQCYRREDAIALVSQTVTELSVTDFEIRADPWGPQGSPIRQEDACRAHVDAGCFVYVGSGWEDDGRRIYYLWGPWP